MRIAQGSPYDLMGEISSFLEVVEKNVSEFYYISNIDTSTLSEDSLPLDSVYTVDTPKDLINIMSAFRKDLFVSVTLPLLALGIVAFSAIGGSFVYTNSSFNRLDDHSRQSLAAISEVTKAQAVSAEQLSGLIKAQQDTNSKLDNIGTQLGAIATGFEVLKSHQPSKPSS